MFFTACFSWGPSQDPEVQWNWPLTNSAGPLNLRELSQSPMPLGFSDQGTQVREEIPTTSKNRLWPTTSLTAYRIFIIVWDFLEQENELLRELWWISRSGFPAPPTPHIPMNLLGGYQEIDVGQLSLYNFLKSFHMPRRPHGSPILNLQSLQHRTTTEAGLTHSGSRQTTLVLRRALCCKWPSTSSSTEAYPPSAQAWTPPGSLPWHAQCAPRTAPVLFPLCLLYLLPWAVTTDLGLRVSHAHLVESTLSQVE